MDALESHSLLIHSVVLGELACGQMKHRSSIMGDLKILPRAVEVDSSEILEMIEAHRLYGKGLSWADCQILASALVTDCSLLTFDRALEKASRTAKLSVL